MKLFFRLLAQAALLLAAGCSSQSSSLSANERRADVLLQAGVDALENSDYTSALRSLNQALKYNPKSPAIYNNLGIAYAGKGETGRAEEAWRKALQLAPDQNDARLNLGILYLNKKHYPEAERTLKEVSKDLSYSKLHVVAYNLAL